MKQKFFPLRLKLIAHATIAISSTNIKHKKTNVCIFSSVFFIPNDIIIEGINFINEINDGLTYLNHLYVNTTSFVGSIGPNLFLSNNNLVGPITPDHGFNGIGTFIQVQDTQQIHFIEPFTNTHPTRYRINRINNLFNSIIYLFTLAGLGIIGNYFRSRPGHTPNPQSSSVNDQYFTYSATQQEEAEKARRTAEKGKKRARDDDDGDGDDGRKNRRLGYNIAKPFHHYTSEMRAFDRTRINMAFNHIRTLGGGTYPILRRIMVSREPDSHMNHGPVVAEDLNIRHFMNSRISEIIHTGIRQTLRNFIYPRLCLWQAEGQGFHTNEFMNAYLGYTSYAQFWFLSPVQSWRFYPDAIYFPYFAIHTDLDLNRSNGNYIDFVTTVHTEADLRRILNVPIHVTLEQYIGLTGNQIKGIFDTLREQKLAPKP